MAAERTGEAARLLGGELRAGVPGAPATLEGLTLSRGAGAARPWTVTLVLVLWWAMWFDPHRWLTVYLPDAVEKLPLALFIVVFAAVIPRLPPADWYWPFLLFLGGMVIMTPFSMNTGRARDADKVVFLGYVLILGLVQLLRRPRYIPQLLLIMLASFAYWAVLGGRNGLVTWHPFYANQDGFGPLMVMGLGFSYYLGLAARSDRIRLLCRVTALLCLVGVVTSFARGAVLSLGALAVLVWVRSPQKLKTLLAALGGLIALLVVTKVMFPDGAFWKEIQSSFTEGTEQGTGADRWWLWQMATDLFMMHPVLGVGPANFGVTATTLPQELVRGDYALNPNTLYGKNTHSIYFTLLSEQGLVGVVSFLWLLIDFWRRNRILKKKAWVSWFDREANREFNLSYVALAIEAAMLAYLLTGFFYAQHHVHWFYTLLGLNFAIHVMLRNSMKAPQGGLSHAL